MSKKKEVMQPTLWVAWVGEDGDDDMAYVSYDMEEVRSQAESWYEDEPDQTIHIGKIMVTETLDPRDAGFPWRKV